MRYLSLLLFALFTIPAIGSQHFNVGFSEVQIPNGSEPPLTVGIWFPTHEPAQAHRLELFTQTVALDAPVFGHNLPLVVISHGGGGSFASHYDTALALARAGVVAAAVSHAGDTYDDQSRVLELWRRPAQLRLLVNYMFHDWPSHDQLDASRVGAFGFSNGGFTVLVAAGGIPDLDKTGEYCQRHAQEDLCVALRHAKVDAFHIGDGAPANAWVIDPRIRAIVVAAPAFAFTFSRSGLENIHIPVQLWRAADDRHQPTPGYEETLLRNMPQSPEYHVVSGGGHYDFLPPCSNALKRLAALACSDAAGFDRARFHKDFNAQIVRFFKRTLLEKKKSPV